MQSACVNMYMTILKKEHKVDWNTFSNMYPIVHVGETILLITIFTHKM